MATGLVGCFSGRGWDGIDSRRNMGFYDKILLLDTSISRLQR
jgi:hypothetical protein